MSIESRLVALERTHAERVHAAPQGPRVEEIRYAGLWALMRQMMAPEHAAMVEDYISNGRGYPLSSGPDALGYHCNGVLFDLAYERNVGGTVWADIHMPPVVAEPYLTAANPLALHECAECGHAYQMRTFATCPLCGGRVGYGAYFATHGKHAPTVRWDGLTALFDEGVDLSMFEVSVVTHGEGKE